MTKKQEKLPASATNDNAQPPVSGYAKGNGKVVHIIVDDVFTLCDKKREMLPEDDKTVKDVSCAKCKRGAVYKNLIGGYPEHVQKAVLDKKVEQPKKQAAEKKEEIDTKDHSDAEKAVAAAHKKAEKDKKKKTAAAKKKPEAKKKEEKKQTQKDLPLNKPAEPISGEPDKNQLLLLANMLSSIKGQFVADMKPNFTYRIKHVTSDRTFFDGVPQDVISQALLVLNNIEEVWDGNGVPSKEFLSKARKAFSEAHELAGREYPESLKDKAAEKKKKQEGKKKKEEKKITKLPVRRQKPNTKDGIKKLPMRRQKKEKDPKPTKLPRRRKKTETLFGKRAGTPIHTVASALIEKPWPKSYLVELLKKKHGMDDKRAKGKFASAIRILTRRLGVVVAITQVKLEKNDIYYIPQKPDGK